MLKGCGHKVAFCATVEIDIIGFTVIVPVALAASQAPDEVRVYGYDPATVGVPLMLMVDPDKDRLTPPGNPFAVALVAVPVSIY